MLYLLYVNIKGLGDLKRPFPNMLLGNSKLLRRGGAFMTFFYQPEQREQLQSVYLSLRRTQHNHALNGQPIDFNGHSLKGLSSPTK